MFGGDDKLQINFAWPCIAISSLSWPAYIMFAAVSKRSEFCINYFTSDTSLTTLRMYFTMIHLSLTLLRGSATYSSCKSSISSVDSSWRYYTKGIASSIYGTLANSISPKTHAFN